MTTFHLHGMFPRVTIGNLSNHDDNGSITESNASARMFYILVHFFAVPCETTTSNDTTIGFLGESEHTVANFLSVFELKSHPYKLGSWTIQLH